MSKTRPIRLVMQREIKRLTGRPVYLYCMILAPIFCFTFFLTLMESGLPTDIPVGVVDEDNTSVTRQVLRNLDAFQQTQITAQYSNFGDAREALQNGSIYAFFYIPKGTTELALASKQPKISFYTNASYLVPASLEYKDMKMMSEYASAALTRATLYAKGYNEAQAMAVLQPIKVEIHPIGNPLLNYSVYLSNILLPGILMLIIFLVTAYSIHSEIKEETAVEWLAMAKDNIFTALAGKLIPQMAVWLVMGGIYMAMLYFCSNFPLNCGIWPMALISVLFIFAAQSFAVFVCELLPSLRWALSIATLWGVLSFPISGFSFPEIAFPASLRALSFLFPLRHYYLSYVSLALDGLPLRYCVGNIAALLIFIGLPLLLPFRLKHCLLNYQYTK